MHVLNAGYTHTSFSLLHESALAGPSTSSGQVNGRKQSPSTVFGTTVPPGHLVRILQKGLLYLEAEARYRGVRLVYVDVVLLHIHWKIDDCLLTGPA